MALLLFFRSSCAYAFVVALTSENGVDISTSITTRLWTNHRSLWPRPHANISKAIWRKKRSPSCSSSGWGELVSRIESNMPFWVCLCPYVYAYALVKTRLKRNQRRKDFRFSHVTFFQNCHIYFCVLFWMNEKPKLKPGFAELTPHLCRRPKWNKRS